MLRRYLSRSPQHSLLVVTTLALVLAHAAPLYAQSNGEEAVAVAPRNVASDQTGVELLLQAHDGTLFAQAAGRAPELVAGDGVEVRDFVIDSPKQARAIVDVEELAFGAIPLQLLVYGLDGESVVLLAETSLGVTGPVGRGPLNLAVSENRRLIPDTSGLQQAGDILIEGPVTGSFSLAAPEGTSFSAANPPVVISESAEVSISETEVSGDESSFSFTVENPDTTQAELRIEELHLDLASFTGAGGERGELAFGLSTMLMPGQSIPISSAHTPGRTIANPDPALIGGTEEGDEGDSGNGDGDPDEGDLPNDGEMGDDDPDQDSGGTGTTTPRRSVGGAVGGTGSSSSPSGSGSSARDSDSSTTTDRRQGSGAQAGTGGSGGGQASQQPRRQANQQRRGGDQGGARRANRDRADDSNRRNRGNRRGRRGRSDGGSSDEDRASPSLDRRNGGASRDGGGDLPETTPEAQTDEGPEASGRIVEEEQERQESYAEVNVYRFRLCDERFHSLPALGFQPAGENGEANGRLVARVWLELVFERDPTPGEQTELTIELAVPGTEPKRVRLVETAPDSGVFRSGPEGVELTLSRPEVR